MRDCLKTDNLLQAAAISAVVTPLSIGRLRESDLPLFFGAVMFFLCMTMVCAAVTAWARRAGMAGVWTDRATLRHGLFAALVLGLVLWPVFLLGLDPTTRDILGGAVNGDMLRLAFPPTARGKVSLILWAAGFQTLFVQAAPMSLAGRLTGNRFAALGLCLLFRLYLSHLQIDGAGLADHRLLLMVPAAAANLLGCLLFARFGLLPAMFFAAVLDARLFLS
jgi:hypothetical protein